MPLLHSRKESNKTIIKGQFWALTARLELGHLAVSVLMWILFRNPLMSWDSETYLDPPSPLLSRVSWMTGWSYYVLEAGLELLIFYLPNVGITGMHAVPSVMQCWGLRSELPTCWASILPTEVYTQHSNFFLSRVCKGLWMESHTCFFCACCVCVCGVSYLIKKHGGTGLES